MTVDLHEYLFEKAKKKFLGAESISIFQSKETNSFTMYVSIGGFRDKFEIPVEVFLWIGCADFLNSAHKKFIEDFETYLKTGKSK